MDATPPKTPATPLCGRDDPAPFVVLEEHGPAPALVVCDHASRAFPQALDRLGLPELPSWQHIAWDIGAGELARGLAHALGAPAVLAGYSRLVVDCNRSPDDVEAFRKESLQRPGLRVVPLLVAVHSFAPTLAGNARPWHAGVLWDHDEANAQRLLQRLRAHKGLVVGDNEPYSGKHPANYTIDHHAKAHGLPHVCIEVRQDLLSSPAGVERWVRLLARIIGEILAEPQSLRLLAKVATHA